MNDSIKKLAEAIDEKGLKVKFGLEQQGHLELIESKFKRYPEFKYNAQIWDDIGKEIGWQPLSAALWYFQFQSPPSGTVIGAKESGLELTSQAWYKHFLGADIYEAEEFDQRIAIEGLLDDYAKAYAQSTKSEGLDLNALEKKLDESLAKETEESITQYLEKERSSTKSSRGNQLKNAFKAGQAVETSADADQFDDSEYNSWFESLPTGLPKEEGEEMICANCGVSQSDMDIVFKAIRESDSKIYEGLEDESDRAAIFIEEIGISGDHMIDVKDGAVYLHDIISGYMKEFNPLPTPPSLEGEGKEEKKQRFCECPEPMKGSGPCCNKCCEIINRA